MARSALSVRRKASFFCLSLAVACLVIHRISSSRSRLPVTAFAPATHLPVLRTHARAHIALTPRLHQFQAASTGRRAAVGLEGKQEAEVPTDALDAGLGVLGSWSRNEKAPRSFSVLQRLWRSWKFLLNRPTLRKHSILRVDLSAPLTGYALAELCESLEKAAVDPRVDGVLLDASGEVKGGRGWAGVAELRRYLLRFKAAGKWIVTFCERGVEQNFALASLADEIYVPPSLGGGFSLRGLRLDASFLAGIFENIGVEPQIKRIGNYKSAGDQFLRSNMSEFQREQLTELLDTNFNAFKRMLSENTGRSAEDVSGLLESPPLTPEAFHEQGWVTGLKYYDEVEALVLKRAIEATTKVEKTLRILKLILILGAVAGVARAYAASVHNLVKVSCGFLAGVIVPLALYDSQASVFAVPNLIRLFASWWVARWLLRKALDTFVKRPVDLLQAFAHRRRQGKKDEDKETQKAKRDARKNEKLKKVLFTNAGKLSKVRPDVLLLEDGAAKEKIAVVFAAGGIMNKRPKLSLSPSGIYTEEFKAALDKVRKDKSVTSVVLRIDSPGGDALASDLMWHEVQRLRIEKPVVASMGSVAASGGYYLAMGCNSIVAEPLTIVGSIGVVGGKFNLGRLYERIGLSKQSLSRGRYAEAMVDYRSYTEDENALADEDVQNSYKAFRDKAAASRGMTPEEMEEHAQGRVYCGPEGLRRGLVDELGGLDVAIDRARDLAGVSKSRSLKLRKVKLKPPGLLRRLSGKGAAASVHQALSCLTAWLRAEEDRASRPTAKLDAVFDSLL